MNTWKGWAHGLLAAMISGFCQTLSATLTMPGTFNLSSETGMIDLLKLGLPNCLLSAFLYLKQSPLPSFTARVVEEKQISLTKE